MEKAVTQMHGKFQMKAGKALTIPAHQIALLLSGLSGCLAWCHFGGTSKQKLSVGVDGLFG
jgi:hypothetical protein